MVFSSFFVRVHGSLLYKNALATYALKVLSFDLHGVYHAAENAVQHFVCINC